MKDGRLLLTVTAAIAMLALVFSAGGAGVAPAGAASPQEEAELQATPQPTEQPNDDTGGQSQDGLKDLDSYRSDMRIDWTGTRSGEPVEGFLSVQIAFVRDPQASEVTMEAAGLGDAPEDESMSMRYVRVGKQLWFYDGSSDTWTQMPAGDDDDDFGFFSPADMLPEINLDTAERARGTETVNDVECYRYDFTEKDMLEEQDLGEVSEASGTIWKAVEGEFVVKATMDAEISSMEEDDLFDKGSVSMLYEVYDINETIVIEPPAEAEGKTGQRDDLPMLPDAEIEFSMAGMVSYTTASSLKEATDFYKEEMPKNGWLAAKDGETMLEDFVLLNYTKGGDKVNIMISTDEDKAVTNVMLSVESASGPLGKDAEMDDMGGDDDGGSTPGGSTIQPPKDVPLMPDAKVDPTSDETYIVYTTSSSLKQIEAFYEQEMPANGWEPEKDNDLIGNGYLDYSKNGGNRVVNLYAAEEDGSVTVDLFIIDLD